MPTQRPLVIYGNCQGEIVHKIFRSLEAQGALAPDLKLTFVRHYDEPGATEAHYDPQAFQNARAAIIQSNQYGRKDHISHLLPKDAFIIRFPYLHSATLWPFHCADARNKPIPQNGTGKYIYGDRLALSLLKKHNNDALKAYVEYLQTDLRKVINLDRIFEIDMKGYDLVDKNSDIPLKPFFEKSFRTTRLLWAINHPTMNFFTYIADQLIKTCASYGLCIKLQVGLTGDPLDNPQTPVHPQIIEHFGLQWVNPNSKYKHFDFGMFTFSEFLYNYLRFD